jgi:pimeloyl-ACP methyl ester carboxylesterase
MREIVQVSPGELAAMRSRPSWASLTATIETSIRQDRALSASRWDPARAGRLHIPTLLLIGDRTDSADLKASVQSLARALPAAKVVVLEGQEHNAMDTDRERLAAVIREFILAYP